MKWLVDQLEDEYKTSKDAAEEYRKSLETKIERLTRMDDMLYDDKLAGDISKERYETKHKDIQEQLQTAKDDLLIADSTVAQKHDEAISLIKLTQSAKDEYLDADMSREEKRSILTELFESATLKDNSISVKYTFFAKAVSKKSSITKEIIRSKNLLNRTGENGENNRGQISKIDLTNEIYPVWQG